MSTVTGTSTVDLSNGDGVSDLNGGRGENMDASAGPKPLPPVLGRLLSGTFWLALKVPLQAVFSLWTVPLVLEAIGPDGAGAYRFAWGFGFFQFLFEFGASSALQHQISNAWTRGDHDGVDRAIASGTTFYAAMALVQVLALLGVAYVALPHSTLEPGSYPLVIKLLWLQALMAPTFGLSMVSGSVLQAARRYDFVPRFELLISILRFTVLYAGVKSGVDFFAIVAAQALISAVFTLGPTLWVMARELGHVPHFRGARWHDYQALGRFSFYIALIQISVVLADQVDTTVLGFMLPEPAGPSIAVYDVASKAFLQLRQVGWMLAYLVMPAAASLAAARDEAGLEKIKYDGSRLHIAALAPIGLLAFLYAAPFLSLWCGNRLGYDAGRVAPLMRLFLVATLPVALSVPTQIAIGLNSFRLIAVASFAGSLVNLPLSCFLTARMGVSGVIWGTVLTTLVSNLIVPGPYLFRTLKIAPRVYWKRTLRAPCAGALALLATTAALQWMAPIADAGPASAGRVARLLVHLSAGTIAYVLGYVLDPAGRADLARLARRLKPRKRAERPGAAAGPSEAGPQ